MDSPAVLEPGTLLAGRFRLGPRLERDWRGDIFQAQDEREGGGSCEVELIRSSGKAEEQLHRLVEREVDIGQMWLKEVPDVLRALAWGQLGPGEVFVARELLPDAKPLEPGSGDLDAKVWQILSAANLVAELHRRGVVHRDLGPRALLQGPGGELRLARFALARLDEVAEPWAGPLGLPLLHLRSAAPEVLLRPSEARTPCDIYALGSLLFRAVVGRWPYAGPSLAQLVQQQQAVLHRAALPPTEGVNVPGGLRKVCARALALTAEERFESVQAFIDALEEWLSVGGAAGPGDEQDSDLGALDLTGGEGSTEEATAPLPAAPPPPVAAAAPLPVLPVPPGDLVVIDAGEGEPDQALEHSGLEGSQEEWILPPDIVPPPLPEIPPLPAPPRPTPGALPRPAQPARSTPGALARPAQPARGTPGAMPRPAAAAAEPVAAAQPEPAGPANDGAFGLEPLTDPGTLKPVEEACPGCEQVGEGVLLIPGSPRELDGRVRALRRADLSALRGLIVDLRWAQQLGGAELESLAALQGLAERRGLRAGLLGASKAVRHILDLMELGSQVPRLLQGSDPEDAAEELLGAE